MADRDEQAPAGQPNGPEEDAGLTAHVYRLSATRPCADTISALQALLARAKRGEVVGIAYGVIYRGREYTVGAAGQCRRDPTYARGIVAHLDEALGDLIHGPVS